MINKIKYSKASKCLTMFLIIGYFQQMSAQNICQQLPANSLPGSFEIVGNITSACSPMAVRLKDLSGATDIRYDFYYDGKAPSQLDKVGNKDSVNLALFSNPNTPRYYTILQYGKKNGKDTYACKTVSVMPNSKPYFPSPANCGPASLTLELPLHEKNKFDSYEINWGDNSPKEIITSLPYKKTYNYTTLSNTRTISVSGRSNGLSCATSTEIISMDGKSGQPKINSIEILNNGKKVSIDLDGFDLDYELYARDPLKSNNYGTTPFSTIKGGKSELDLPFSPQTCFTVFYYPNCPKTSGEICTNNINELKPDGLNNYLEWDEYKLGKTNTGFVDLDATSNQISRKLIKTQADDDTKKTEILVTSVMSLSDVIDCKKNYCYQLVSEVNGITSGSKMVPYSAVLISEKKCISRDTISPPAISDISITVDDDKFIELKYTDNSGWNVTSDSLLIFKLKKETGLFEILDIKKTPLNTYVDKEVETNTNVYTYKIAQKDICGSTSIWSPEVSNILLKSDKNQLLNWSNLSPFGNQTIQTFSLLEYQEETDFIKNTYDFNSNLFTYKPNLVDFNKEATFKIIGKSNNGLVSSSNAVVVPINAELYFPNAFSPNKDAKNDSFEIKGKPGGVESFKMQVYNRWGALVFETTDINTSWDGNINNLPAPSGKYLIYIYLKSDGNEPMNKKTELTILNN